MALKMTQSTVEKIIKAAESQVRAGGYNSFSFREIAKEIGIKSASIHYHFPTKTDLSVAIVNRYTIRFEGQLTHIFTSTIEPMNRLKLYITLFRQALKVDKKMCLCGVLASQSDVLPEALQAESKAFFKVNTAWLSGAIFPHSSLAEPQANLILASLEGALLLSKAMQSDAPFEQIANLLLTHKWQ